MEGVERTLFVLEATQRLGCLTVAVLARQTGWNKASASRYLTEICQRGWLERVNEKGFPKYVLGHKVLSLAPDLSFGVRGGQNRSTCAVFEAEQ